MIFADRVSEEMPDVRTLLEGSRIVRIHTDVADAVAELVWNEPGSDRENPKIKELSKYTCWPDNDCWLEWADEVPDGVINYGFLFLGDMGKSVMIGRGLLFIHSTVVHGVEGRPRVIPVRFDMENYTLMYQDHYMDAEQKALALPADSSLRSWWERYRPLHKHDCDVITLGLKYADLLRSIKPMLFGILAFMNSPKLIRKRESDLGRLNARRIKRGKYPYHPHHEIRLNIDKHDLTITPGQGDGPERAQHFVRAHLRFLVHPRFKNVSVVLVPPHYRGNPELGMRNTSYAVDRQHSRWVE